MENNISTRNSIYIKKIRLSDKILKAIIILSAIGVIASFLSILIYVIAKGIFYINLDFLISTQNTTKKGILPIIINTIYVQLTTLLIATPVGVATAVYITEYNNNSMLKIVDFLSNMLAGIPSILFGLFGYNIFCVSFGLTPCIAAGCLTLSCCILPNIISNTKEAILAVPLSYKQGALALGAKNFTVIKDIIIPCAMPGILTGIILSAGKIVGESAALLLTVGNGTKMPTSIFGHLFKSARTLTLHLYLTAGNATSEDAMNICFATATVLIFLVFFLNCLTKILAFKFSK